MKYFTTQAEEQYYNQLQEAISLLKSIYSDRDDRPIMTEIEEFLNNIS